jgi:hypothetical protein
MLFSSLCLGLQYSAFTESTSTRVAVASDRCDTLVYVACICIVMYFAGLLTGRGRLHAQQMHNVAHLITFFERSQSTFFVLMHGDYLSRRGDGPRWQKRAVLVAALL